jgi:ACS family glucarate transporter-like MFS transporter
MSSGKYRYRVLGMLFLLSMITYLDRICISIAGPRMQKELAIPPEMWGWVISLFTLAYALFEIPAGMMGDRFGPRRVLTVIVLWWSASTILTGIVPTVFLLLAMRFLFGLGAAGAYPNSSVAVARWFPATERARAQGVIWMASRIGGAIAPLLVIPLQIFYGWRVAFWFLGAMGAVWAAMWYWWFRDNPAEKSGVREQELAEIGGGSGRHHHALPWRIALRNGNFWTLLLMYNTYCWGANFYMSWLHTYLQKGRGFTEKGMGLFSMFPFLLGAVANGVGGFLSDHLVRKYGLKWGRRLIGGIVLMFSASLFLVTASVTSKAGVVVSLALGYGCMDMMLPSAWAICLDIGRKYAGAVTGAMNMVGQLGSFLSAVVFGYLVAHFHSYNAPLVVLAAMQFISALLFFRIDATKLVVPEQAEAGQPAGAS